NVCGCIQDSCHGKPFRPSILNMILKAQATTCRLTNVKEERCLKQLPIRRRKIAEDYAKKVRVEPSKQTRKEDPKTIRLRGQSAGVPLLGPARKNENKKP